MTYAKASMECLERQFAGLVARGFSYADAYRQIKPRSRDWEPKALRVEACRFAAQPNVILMVRELLSAAKIHEIDSVGRAYQELLADLDAAREAKNYTAVAALTRVRTQILGMLKDHVVLHPYDELDDEALVARLGKGDVAVTAMLSRLLGKSRFDA